MTFRLRALIVLTVIITGLFIFQNCAPAGGGNAFNIASGNGTEIGNAFATPTPALGMPGAPSPSPSPAASSYTRKISSGSSACAVTSAGAAVCWGSNSYGELGNGTMNTATTPSGVIGLSSGVSQISAGILFACGLTTGGGAECWGSNAFGQLGNGNTTSSTTPVAVFGLSSGVSQIATGTYFACALTTAGAVKCWGGNGVGELGNGTTTSSYTPVFVSGLTSGVASIAAWFEHACALKTDGTVWCWGYNTYGQLGNGTSTNSSVPVQVSGLSGATNIAVGYGHSCAVLNTGAVKCWGENQYGQLGNNSTVNALIPVSVTGLSASAVNVSGGSGHTCVTLTTGGIQCWGWNAYGQLGNLSTTNSSVPVTVGGLTASAVEVETGNIFTCARQSNGQGKCWGYGVSGQLGNGSTTSSSTAVTVSGLTM